MVQQDYGREFDKINELYAQYAELAAKQDADDFEKEWKNAYKTIREKLIISVCKIYFKFENTEGSCEKISPITNANKNDDNFSDVVVEEIINSMETYDVSVNEKNSYPFSKFVCTNVSHARGKALSKKIASDNHGGSCISEYEASMIRKISKKDKDLERFGTFDESKRNIVISKMLEISVDLVIKYKNLAKNNTTETDRTNSEGETFSVFDVEQNDQTEKQNITPETILIENFDRENFPIFMKEIDKIYSKKRDEKLSLILTVMFLKPYESRKSEHISFERALSEFYPEVFELLKDYDFISKDILNSFFEDISYELPSQQMIADKFNVDKSAITQIIKRFRKNLASNKKLLDAFEDFLG